MQGKYCNNNSILTCEGETEKWYFEHLRELINSSSDCCMKANYKPEVNKKPIKKAKILTILYETKWYHIMDRESPNKADKIGFVDSLNAFKDIKKIRPKAKLMLGYTNIAFELWLIMHKTDELPQVHTAKNYFKYIQKLYNLQNIECFDAYKQKENFERVLNQISLEDVKNAVMRGIKLEKDNHSCCKVQKIRGFEYFEDNPSTSLHNVVKSILTDIGLSI